MGRHVWFRSKCLRRESSSLSSRTKNGGTATTVVLRQTVNLLRKVNIVGSTPTPFTKLKIRAGSLRGKTTGYYDIVDVIGIEANPVH